MRLTESRFENIHYNLMISNGDLTLSAQSGAMAHSHSGTATRLLVFFFVWAISCGYMATHLKRGWVPLDEGTLGLSAERVLQGQMPHRDFDDYTGGLTYVHSWAFRMLGISSATMRIVLFAFFVAWVPTVFYVASRFASTIPAGAVTLLAVAWSVPNYPGPMPSWYNLFFATAGLAALLRYIDNGARRWIFLAGLCGALSFLAKIAAAYFVAAVLLFFVFREQSITLERNRGMAKRARFYSATVVFGLTVFMALLFSMVHKISDGRDLFYFFLPAVALVFLLIARECAGVAGSDQVRFRELMGMCLPFLAGLAIPLAAFVIPYAFAGAIHALIRGLLLAPSRAMSFVVFAPSHPAAALTVIPFVLPVILAYECRALGRAIWGGLLAGLACAVLFFSAKSSFAYGLGWLSLRTATPALVVTGAVMLWFAANGRQLSELRRQQIMLLSSVAALCSLIQFPFSTPVYFFYTAPLVILLATALFTSMRNPPRLALATLLAFYLLFVFFRITPGFIYNVGGSYAPDMQTVRLTIARAGGLRVEEADARVYDRLIPLVQAHAGGEFIYSGPDCPEVYFLSGLQSPSRNYSGPEENSSEGLDSDLRLLEGHDVHLVVINRGPRLAVSKLPDLATQSELEKRYPHHEEIGWFEVRWRK